jgi:hypothetical protein
MRPVVELDGTVAGRIFARQEPTPEAPRHEVVIGVRAAIASAAGRG